MNTPQSLSENAKCRNISLESGDRNPEYSYAIVKNIIAAAISKVKKIWQA